MNALANKLTNKLRSYDEPVGMPLSPLTQFHEQAELTLPNGEGMQILEANETHPEKTYEDGLVEGRLQAVVEREENVKSAAQMMREFQTVGQRIEASHARFTLAVLRAALPALANANMIEEIKAFLTKITAQALQGKVILQAPPKLENQLKAALVEISSEASDARLDTFGFSVEIDAKYTGHDICAAWHNGGAMLDIDGAVQGCLALLGEKYRGNEDG